MQTIQIHSEDWGLIGDALCAVPFMEALCRKHDAVGYITGGFNESVRNTLDSRSYPFVFSKPEENIELVFPISLPQVWQHCSQGWKLHMAQGYFSHYGLPIPALPISLKFRKRETKLPPGIVISPYSRSNSNDNNKLWSHDNWATVIRQLQLCPELADTNFYIVGSNAHDDFTPYQKLDNTFSVFDTPLPHVLTLLRQAKLVMSLDNGIAHLAHFGGVTKHLMIYANVLPPKFAESPYAFHLRGNMPRDIKPYQVITAAKTILLPQLLLETGS